MRMFLCFAMAILAALAATGAVWAQANDGRNDQETSDTDPGALEVKTSEEGIDYVPGELVMIKKGGAKEDNIEVVPVAEQTLKGLKERAKKINSSRSDAATVEPNYLGRVDATPNDYHYPDQYHLPQIGAPKAWSDTKGAGVRICVIDSGYDRRNAEFSLRTVAEHDFIQDDKTAQYSSAHGTHVAGIAAAETNNKGGTAGVGWDSRLVHAKVTTSNGKGTTADAARALNFCQNVGGVSVANMSLGFDADSDALRGEIAQSYKRGITVVASVGNDGEFKTQYPAGYRDQVIGVGASNPNGTLASFSNKGANVDLVAPGVNIRSNVPVNSVAEFSGTSMSAPQVAGSAALLYAKGLNRDQVRSRLFNNAEDRGAGGRDDYWGHGFLNVGCATQPDSDNCPPR